MTYEQSPKIYLCCGQYIATTKAVSDKKIKCPRCGQYQSSAIEFPEILIVKS